MADSTGPLDTKPQLPPEIWFQILSFIQAKEARGLYTVNRLFYECALAVRYRHVDVDLPSRHYSYRPFPSRYEAIVRNQGLRRHVKSVTLQVPRPVGPTGLTLLSAILSSMFQLVWGLSLLFNAASGILSLSSRPQIDGHVWWHWGMAFGRMLAAVLWLWLVLWQSVPREVKTTAYDIWSKPRRAITQTRRHTRLPWMRWNIRKTRRTFRYLRNVTELHVDSGNSFMPDFTAHVDLIAAGFAWRITTLDLHVSSNGLSILRATAWHWMTGVESLSLRTSNNLHLQLSSAVASFVKLFRETLRDLSLDHGQVFGGSCAAFKHLDDVQFPLLSVFSLRISLRNYEGESSFPNLHDFLEAHRFTLQRLGLAQTSSLFKSGEHLSLPSLDLDTLEINDNLWLTHREELLNTLFHQAPRRLVVRFEASTARPQTLFLALETGVYDIVVLNIYIKELCVTRQMLRALGGMPSLQELTMDVTWVMDSVERSAINIPSSNLDQLQDNTSRFLFSYDEYLESSLSHIDITRLPRDRPESSGGCTCSPIKLWGLMKLFAQAFPSIRTFADLGNLDAPEPSGSVYDKFCNFCLAEVFVSRQKRAGT